MEAPPSNQAIHDKVNTILEGPEYQAFHTDAPNPGDDALSKWLEQFDKWLKDLFSFDPPQASDASNSDVLSGLIHYGFMGLLGLVALVVVGLLLWWVWSVIADWRRARRGQIKVAIVSESERLDVQQHRAGSAEASLAAGDYRQAIHYLFLAAIARLVDDQVFDVTDMMTNRELLAHCRLETTVDTVTNALNQLHVIDEPRWFGSVDAKADDYSLAHTYYETFNKHLLTVTQGGNGYGINRSTIYKPKGAA